MIFYSANLAVFFIFLSFATEAEISYLAFFNFSVSSFILASIAAFAFSRALDTVSFFSASAFYKTSTLLAALASSLAFFFLASSSILVAFYSIAAFACLVA